ncbi:hypothetical protein OSB04_029269 [Centaurea solstitialis]|uniref:Uncharacterized protein n=1 Tax=Centaurea solstitialis TaxID=347529 RepID=A0AA38SPU3_9ASTR|nr:hypothetical protein OSB04_029269 [Centaurea solstitialis]
MVLVIATYYIDNWCWLQVPNRAAIVTNRDTNIEGTITKPWNLCTLQQVEDLKTLIRISPLWSTGILLCTPIAILVSLLVVQALAMDRHLGPHFKIPAGSMIIFVMITTSIALSLIDRFLIPTWQKLTGSSSTPLQRIGFGHTLIILSMVIAALVESKRLNMAQSHKLNGNLVVPMSTLWLVPQLVVLGFAAAFHLPAQSLKSTSAAMVAVFTGIAFYLATVMVDLVRKTTGWLPDGINDGRIDNVYWVLTVIGIVNFGYYLICAWLNQNISVMEGSASVDGASSSFTHGGWITFPFFIATMAGLTLAAAGWSNNVIVYLIREFNMKNIDAAQIANILNGCINLFPIVAAIVADSYLGSFSVIVISTSLSLLGLILLTLTAILDTLKPPPCETGSSFCQNPSKPQLAILYISLALASLGAAGTRFTLATMGADQFRNPNHQGVFFNWHFFTFYAATLGSVVGIIYIEDDVSWGLGFGLCVAANLVGLVVFVFGRRYYHLLKPQGSPFTGLACVMVAAFRKRKTILSFKSEDYCHGPQDEGQKRTTPSNNFNLCTLQQVENLKTLVRISPLWSTGILLGTPIAIQLSLIVLQALAMDRHVGSRFQIPAGSMIVFVMIATSIALALIDRFLIPMWQKLTGRTPSPLQIIGLGHTLTISSMAISALVESRRLSMARAHNLDGNSVVPMSTFWLVPQLVVVGVAEAFNFPGQVSLYYQEFPKSLKSTAAALVALFIGIAFHLGTAVVVLVRKTTRWLPDGINDGRMDNVYWMLTVIGIASFGYYLVCAWFYKYQNVEKISSTPELQHV